MEAKVDLGVLGRDKNGTDKTEGVKKTDPKERTTKRNATVQFSKAVTVVAWGVNKEYFLLKTRRSKGVCRRL